MHDDLQSIRSVADWHNLTTDQVAATLHTTQDGLSASEVYDRRTSYGINHLPESPRQGTLKRFLLQFHNVLIYVLLVAAVITALLSHYSDTTVILAVVIINAVIGFIQESKAGKAMDAIKQMLAPMASVIRDGKSQVIKAEDLVPGDLVLLETGDKVPADLRLSIVNGLAIQESLLTGESLPVEKSTLPVNKNAAVGDRSCMAYSGTLVTSGNARGIVIATGKATEIGRIGNMLAEVQDLDTPLVSQMREFAKWLTVVILSFSVVLLLYGYFILHHDFAGLFMVVVGLSVAAMPEGLPAVLTITLAIGVRALSRRNAIIRRLPAIEALGSVSVICTDKTGTLTMNEMMVSDIVTADRLYRVIGSGYLPEGEIRIEGVRIDPLSEPVLREILMTGMLCNDASLHQHKTEWTVHGDPMEGALLVLARKGGLSGLDVKRDWPRTDTIPFDSRHRFMATLHHNHEGRGEIMVKGAPEHILAMCRQQYNDNGAITAIDVTRWQQQANDIAAKGRRVLALATRDVEPGQTTLALDDVTSSLVLLGLVGLLDPPRPEAMASIEVCRSAGIKVKMITGDHAYTAAAIARQIGIENPDTVLTGSQLETIQNAELIEAVKTTNVFARTSPEHKLRLVTALQELGEVVAMTGDGVNDAPALKRADAGIAMGKKGSEAAKEASELVLADDNFATIVAAVREGRTVYDNLQKVISWTLPTNAGEAATIAVALLFGMTLPVTPVQILWVNLITEATLGISLAFEPTETNTMSRRPRQRYQALISGTLIWHMVLVSVLFLAGVLGMFNYAIERGYSIELARTISVNTLVVLQIFHLFFIRNIYGTSLTWKGVSGTPTVWLTVSVVTVAQFAITYLPPLQRVFDTRPIPIIDGILIVGTGVLLLAVVELEKQIRLKLSTPITGSTKDSTDKDQDPKNAMG